MRIKVVSDLHLEFSDVDIKNEDDIDVLILSGDILVANDLHDHPEMDYSMYSNDDLGNLGSRQLASIRFRNFLKRCSFQFPHVVYVAGNHEFYHGKFVSSLTHLRDECAKFPNIYFLERDVKIIDDVVFVGATLWTDCNRGDPLTLHSLTDMMNDFQLIRHDGHGYTRLRPAHIMHRHQQTLEYFKEVITNRKDQKIVVVGHHAPSYNSIHPDYKNDHLGNGGYASDLSEFILDNPHIKLWTHGHVHQCFDYMIGETRIVCNPRGYEGYEPNTGWNPKHFVEV